MDTSNGSRPLPPDRERSAWLLAVVALAFACPGDDTVPSDGGGSADVTGTNGTTTNGVTSTSGPSTASSTDPTTTATTAADSTGEPPAAACLCTSPNELGETCDFEALAAWVPGCPEVQPCSPLTVECPRAGADLYDCTTELVFDETAMQCMLEVLRDATPARLEIDGLEDYGVFSGQSIYAIHVMGPQPVASDRLALRAGCIPVDAGVESFAPAPYLLADPDYFTACMAVADPAERYDCMMSGLSEITCENA